MKTRILLLSSLLSLIGHLCIFLKLSDQSFLIFPTSNLFKEFNSLNLKVVNRKISPSTYKKTNSKRSLVKEISEPEIPEIPEISKKYSPDDINEYFARVSNMIEKNKFYPSVARRLEQTGEVIVLLILKNDGSIVKLGLERRSIHESLNQAALETIRKVESFPSFPKEITAEFLTLRQKIYFEQL
jgi:TonB family protein